MQTGLQFIKFSFIGALNTAVHYFIFLILFRGVETPMILALAIGYFVGMLNSFFLNRSWTFKSSGSKVGAELTKFIVVNLFSLGLNLLVLQLLVSYAGLIPEIAQAVAIFFSLIVNFSANKWWTFTSNQ